MQNRRRPSRAFLLVVVLPLLAACPEADDDPSTDTGPRDVDGGPRDSDGGPRDSDGGPGSELDCPGIFDCAARCGDDDDPCVEACIDRASAETLELVRAILVCAEDNSCTEEACLSANCAPEVAACSGEEVPCDHRGVPELTGPVVGLASAYTAGDPMAVSVPVDEDTRRVIVGIYEVGSNLYLGGAAEDTAPSSTVPLMPYAGVAGGATGTFFLSIELCSTSVCTPPFIRNTYDRVDREVPLGAAETYQAIHESVGGDAMAQTCTTAVPIQTFEID